MMDRKTLKVNEATHRELKTQAAKAGVSMVEYLDRLLKEVKNNEKQ